MQDLVSLLSSHHKRYKKGFGQHPSIIQNECRFDVDNNNFKSKRDKKKGEWVRDIKIREKDLCLSVEEKKKLDKYTKGE